MILKIKMFPVELNYVLINENINIYIHTYAYTECQEYVHMLRRDAENFVAIGHLVCVC